MQRKDFIKSLGILAATSLSTDVIGNTLKVNANSLQIKKGLGYWMIKEDLSLLDKFKLVKDLGFDGIEFNSPLDIPLKDLLEARDKTGIEVPSTVNKDHWGKPISDPDPAVRKFTIDSMAKSLEQTKELGGDTVLLVPGVVSDTVSYKTAYGNALDSIRKMIPHAEKTGVKIALENVWNNFILSPIEAKDFLDKIDHPLVGWYFDLGNILRYGWPDHWLEVLGDKVFKLHVKEYSKKIMNEEGLGKGFNIELTQGDVNWSQVMKTIKDINYKGQYMTLEVNGGDRTVLKKLSEQLDTIIKS
ncbi:MULTISPECIES: sugar phosphate isomerase/epimerase [unclassified Sphingobacterium]|uniref:sugar phosphate isomerase/epimerase family protein n=1 Tax=unclassified Sphingobacterium TaxID=2609468 RepID=UPI0020C1C18F|nr:MULTISPECIES: sugar phosphate isomerase/epimerase family protein [unclassified Sphingobacterium]